MKQPKAQKILTTKNAKLLKGGGIGFLTAGIHFAPASLSGHNVCAGSSAGCRMACLATSGHGRYARVQEARVVKTQRFYNERETFMAQLVKEIEAVILKAKRENLTPAFRLNLTSDVAWENIQYQGKTIFEHFPDANFYDYSKIIKRVLPNSKARSFPNYHLTFSRSESNQAFVELAVNAGVNVAVVFAGATLPKTYLGRPVVSGDETDVRFLDPQGVIVGLTTKGRARHDKSGFVVPASI